METPLHIAVRLGLYHLTLFYLHQPGGQEMATLPNEEGHTPIELAQNRGHAATISAFAKLVTFILFLISKLTVRMEKNLL